MVPWDNNICSIHPARRLPRKKFPGEKISEKFFPGETIFPNQKIKHKKN